ncbi:MAG: UbiX family flavin prenyltransferase [Kistimonas sp.]|nr:UbiX family flavin prenyltransferase [Kistimonas sp.]
MNGNSSASREQIIVLGMTGASGAPYTWRLLECLLAANRTVFFMISKAARLVSATETSLRLPSNPRALEQALRTHYQVDEGRIRVFGEENWMAPVASGSGIRCPMVICPASMGVISAIAAGASNCLIERAADVALKEGRKLVLVPRESPLSAIHLENMLKLSRMNAVILPASPGLYHRPSSVAALLDFIVARILDQLEVEHTLIPRWGQGGTEQAG